MSIQEEDARCEQETEYEFYEKQLERIKAKAEAENKKRFEEPLIKEYGKRKQKLIDWVRNTILPEDIIEKIVQKIDTIMSGRA